MRIMKRLAIFPALAILAACGPDESSRTPDLSFLNELESAVPAVETQSAVSAEELGLATAEESVTPTRQAPVAPAARQTTRSSAPRASGTQESAGPAVAAPTARVETVKHTKRDAAIGAGAGAVIGAVVAGPGERAQGAAIGAVVGGVLGGVIGNNVDKSTRVVYE